MARPETRKVAAYVGSQIEAGRTRKDLAKELGLSNSRVRQLHMLHKSRSQDETYWALPTRARNCLLNSGVNPNDKTAILVFLEESLLTPVPNLGPGTRADIEKWVEGLHGGSQTDHFDRCSA